MVTTNIEQTFLVDSLANSLSCCNGFFTRIRDNQMSAINYVLLLNDICTGVKRVTKFTRFDKLAQSSTVIGW